MAKVSPEARALTARLAEVGVELAPSAVERLIAALRLAQGATGSTAVALEVEEGWGLELVVDDEGTLKVDVFLIEADAEADDECSQPPDGTDEEWA